LAFIGKVATGYYPNFWTIPQCISKTSDRFFRTHQQHTGTIGQLVSGIFFALLQYQERPDIISYHRFRDRMEIAEIMAGWWNNPISISIPNKVLPLKGERSRKEGVNMIGLFGLFFIG